MKRLFLGLMCLGCLFFLSGCMEKRVSNGYPTKIVIGTQQLPNDEMLAIVKGYFEEEFKLPVEILEFQAGDIRNAVVSKDIDFAMLGSSSAILGFANGMKVECIWIHDIISTAEQLIVRNDSGIKELKDLKGKKLAAPFTSTAHYSILKSLEVAEIKEEDVTLFDMQMPEIYTSFIQKEIDGAYVWEPTLSKMVKDGGYSVITSEDLAKKGMITANVEIVRKDFANRYPELVVSYLKALNRAKYDIKNNHENVVEVLSDYLGQTNEEVDIQVKGSIHLDAKELIQKKYLGNSKERGDFTDTVIDTAHFLYEQQSLTDEPDIERLETFIEPKYAEMLVEEINGRK